MDPPTKERGRARELAMQTAGNGRNEKLQTSSAAAAIPALDTPRCVQEYFHPNRRNRSVGREETPKR